MTWDDAVAGYLTHLEAGGASTRSRKLRRSYLSRFAAAHPDGPGAVDAADCAAFLARPGWSPETRKSARSTLRSFFDWAVDAGVVDHDPTARLPPVRVPPAAPRPAPIDAIEQAWALAGERERLMILLALLAGLRRGEIARVQGRDLEHHGGRAYLRVHGKGGRVRVVPAHPALVARLADAPAGYVFPGKEHGHLSANHTGRILRRLLGDHTAHSLRHAAASRWYSVDQDLLAVQQLLGHSSVATTQRYVRVDAEALTRAVDGGPVPE